jgi:hypothetical protein
MFELDDPVIIPERTAFVYFVDKDGYEINSLEIEIPDDEVTLTYSINEEDA